MLAAIASRPLVVRPARIVGRRGVVVQASGIVNPDIQKDNPKVVDTIDVASIEKKAVVCRCWRSKKFPYCDGAHVQHNKDTGDNVGPLIIEKK